MPRVALAALLVVALVGRAHAQQTTGDIEDEGEDEDDEVEPEYRHYGWQTLLLDATALTLIVSADDEEESRVGVGLYVLGGPTVHALHGHGLRAMGSLALRVVVPVGAFYLTAPFGLPVAAFGLGIGIVAVSIYDGGQLARDPVEGRAARSRAAWAPTLQLDARGASLGVAGTF